MTLFVCSLLGAPMFEDYSANSTGGGAITMCISGLFSSDAEIFIG